MLRKHETDRLLRAGIVNPVEQRYLVWRRSVFWAAMIPTLLTAVLGTLDELDFTKLEAFNSLGITLAIASDLMAFVLPVCAIAGGIGWVASRASRRWFLLAWTVAFLFPILLALCPIESVIRWSSDPEKRQWQERLVPAQELLVGVEYYLELTPVVLSVIPGMLRACIRMKSLLPASLVPGWFLVAGAPLYLLLWLTVFVVINQFAGSPLLILGVLLLFGAPMVYVVHSDAFLEPVHTEEGFRRIGRIQLLRNLLVLAGLASLIWYLMTKKLAYGVGIVGLDEETSFLWLLERQVELGTLPDDWTTLRPESLVWLGDWRLYRFFLDYLGRALMAAVVFADVLMELNITVWRHQKAFLTTEASVSYDRLMEDLARGDRITTSPGGP